MKYILSCFLLFFSFISLAQNTEKKHGKANKKHRIAKTGYFNEGGDIKIQLSPVDTTIDSAKLKAIAAAKKPVELPDSLLYWKTNLALSWDDFRGKPDTKLQWDAYAYTGFNYSYKSNPSRISVQSIWYKKKSWKKPKANLTTPLLIHEKVHFNITELYARKLRFECKALEHNITDPQQDIAAIYKRLVAEKDAMQVQYDNETEHSKNAAKQAEWNMKISSMLNALSAFSSE